MNDLTGKTFGSWTVIRFSHRQVHANYWICKCKCGKEKPVEGRSLYYGHSKSCGCSWKHHLSNTKLHKRYCGMLDRCYCKGHHAYADYGGRGITVCKGWKKSYITFLNWATTNGFRENLEIDRINNNGNYEPSNCRWATIKEQANNRRARRGVKTIVYRGIIYTFKQFSKKTGIKTATLYSRHNKGWSDETLIKNPNEYHKKGLNLP